MGIEPAGTGPLHRFDREARRQTGKFMWAYQLTPHDIYDYDLENSPIISNANGRRS